MERDYSHPLRHRREKCLSCVKAGLRYRSPSEGPLAGWPPRHGKALIKKNNRKKWRIVLQRSQQRQNDESDLYRKERRASPCVPSRQLPQKNFCFPHHLKPFITLATARTPEGTELTLHSHDGNFFLRANRQPLMGTNASLSERCLAEQACQPLGTNKNSRVLIGGLGFGFSLRRVLELVSRHSKVHVAELLPEVVKWNHEFLMEVNGKCLDDPRVRVLVEDVFQVMSNAPAGHYDAILLDVDNGPIAMVKDGNERLYEERGFAVIIRALKPGGRVAFWSASQDSAFEKRLTKAGFKVEAVGAKAYEQARRNSHTIFVADSPDPGLPPKSHGSSTGKQSQNEGAHPRKRRLPSSREIDHAPAGADRRPWER